MTMHQVGASALPTMDHAGPRSDRALMSNQFDFDVFLSHSSKDKDVVRAVAERLRHDGLKVWFDEWEIHAGDNIPAKIEEGLEQSRVLVLFMSANAFGSDWAQLESGTFRFRDPLNKERRFVPLRLDDAPIKGTLAQFLYIIWLPKGREREYAKLLEACRAIAEPPITKKDATTVEQAAQVIAVHLHPDFRYELGGLLEIWNSSQPRLLFNPVRPPQDIESILLSESPLECEVAERLATRIREAAHFEEQDGLFQFCEGRLFGDGFYQLYSCTSLSVESHFDSSTVSLFMMRKLTASAQTKMPLFGMVVQSMLYGLGITCGLPQHQVTRTCVMDFNNEMPDMLLGLDHGPKFCPQCAKIARECGNDHLLVLAASAKKFLHGTDSSSGRTP